MLPDIQLFLKLEHGSHKGLQTLVIFLGSLVLSKEKM